MKLQDRVGVDRLALRLEKAIRKVAEDTSEPSPVRRACRRALRAAQKSDARELRQLRRRVLDQQLPAADRLAAIDDAVEVLRDLREV